MMAGILGALLEAWEELRIHKMRVLLSLLGVTVAVGAMTGISALVSTSDQLQREMIERQSGREGSLIMYTYDEEPSSDPSAGMLQRLEQYATFLAQHEITHASRNT